MHELQCNLSVFLSLPSSSHVRELLDEQIMSPALDTAAAYAVFVGCSAFPSWIGWRGTWNSSDGIKTYCGFGDSVPIIVLAHVPSGRRPRPGSATIQVLTRFQHSAMRCTTAVLARQVCGQAAFPLLGGSDLSLPLPVVGALFLRPSGGAAFPPSLGLV